MNNAVSYAMDSQVIFQMFFFNCMYSGSYRCIHFGSSLYEEVYRFFVTIGVIEVRKGY